MCHQVLPLRRRDMLSVSVSKDRHWAFLFDYQNSTEDLYSNCNSLSKNTKCNTF